MNMELRRLRYFVAVAEELNFRRAAEQLHVAQPAVSQQVRKLEVELGVELFRRSKRAVALTAAGATFLDEARRTLRQAETAAQAARQASDGSLGRLRIGYPAGPLPTRLSETITRFAVRFPGIGVVPETVSARQAVTDVTSGRIDVAVVGLPILAPGLRVTPLSEEQTVAAVPDRHRLSGRPELQLDRLGETPLILLPRGDNPAFHDGVLSACRSAGVAPTILETNESSVDHVLLLVAAGMGVALLPESATRYGAPAVRFLPVTDPQLTTEMALITRSDGSDAPVEGLLHLARERGSTMRMIEAPAAADALAA
jgi:DNA-binding transcriptional LysR family regulator